MVHWQSFISGVTVGASGAFAVMNAFGNCSLFTSNLSSWNKSTFREQSFEVAKLKDSNDSDNTIEMIAPDRVVMDSDITHGIMEGRQLDSIKMSNIFQVVIVDGVSVGDTCYEANVSTSPKRCLTADGDRLYSWICDIDDENQRWVLLDWNKKICLAENNKKCLGSKKPHLLRLGKRANGFSWEYNIFSSKMKATSNDDGLVLSVKTGNRVVLESESDAFQQNWYLDFWLPTKAPSSNPTTTTTPTAMPTTNPTVMPTAPPTTKYNPFQTTAALQSAVDTYCASPEEWENEKDYENYGPITIWDVSKITNMNRLFFEKECNPDVSNWDVSSVTDFGEIFTAYDTNTFFNQDISQWDVSKGVYFDWMFARTPFNHDISQWNVANGHSFEGMFYEAAKFNHDITEWDVSNGLSFENMFPFIRTFNQNIGGWNVSKSQSFQSMFTWTSFNQDISQWDVANAQNFNNMFTEAHDFNQDIGQWNVSNGQEFGGVFIGAKSFNQDISGWNVAKGTKFSYMFNRAEVFDQNLCLWGNAPFNSKNFCNLPASCGDPCP